jgi:diguanylate cyclase (GGDEF)-like protein
MTTAKVRSTDIVPLAERLRYMQLFRFVATCLVLVVAFTAPEIVNVGLGALVTLTGAYLLMALVSEELWRRTRRRGLTLFGAMIIADGFFLAYVGYATGGIGSPLRHLTLLHLITVALLASYRTGMKLALWHSLLLFVVHHAQEAGLLTLPHHGVETAMGSDFQQLIAFAATFWLVAIGTATFSAINERELRRRKYDLEALARMAAEIETAPTATAVAEVVLAHVTDAFDFERALLGEADQNGVSLLAERGCGEPSVTGSGAPADSLIETSWSTKQTLLVSELDRERDPWLTALLPQGRNLIVVPLFAEGRATGALVLEHGTRRSSRVERRVVSMVERFASHAALALCNARLVERLETMAATDGLTQVANRRTFETALERELSRATRAGEELALLMVDIDRFKQVNDSHGHQAGDEVLRQVAGALVRECRDFDTVARYGGEEFAVILPRTSEANAMAVAERLRHAIARADIVTVSVGVAAFPAHGIDTASLVKAADEALYESKRAGRDRVTGARREGDGQAVGVPRTPAPDGIR